MNLNNEAVGVVSDIYAVETWHFHIYNVSHIWISLILCSEQPCRNVLLFNASDTFIAYSCQLRCSADLLSSFLKFLYHGRWYIPV